MLSIKKLHLSLSGQLKWIFYFALVDSLFVLFVMVLLAQSSLAANDSKSAILPNAAVIASDPAGNGTVPAGQPILVNSSTDPAFAEVNLSVVNAELVSMNFSADAAQLDPNSTSPLDNLTTGFVNLALLNESFINQSPAVYSIPAIIQNGSNASQDMNSNQSNNIALIKSIITRGVVIPLMNASPIEPSAALAASNLSQNQSNQGDIVAVSQLGYHPSSVKEVVVYTVSQNGIFNIRDAGSSTIVASLQLQRPRNYAGAIVNCQGNMPCLTGDFTNFTAQGTYYIEENGVISNVFSINKNIFSSTVPIFFEFFDAQLQQGSSYHADFHSGYNPQFTSMSDGSFIMEADQAALALIRLGSAYRRDPQLFQFDNYNILAAGKPDMQEYTASYAAYLEGLQGISVKAGNGQGAVRLGSGMMISNIFVPGPTNLTTLKVYIPGSPPVLLQTAPVVSLCGADDHTAQWQACIKNAAEIYKCQADEPCLNLTYIDRTGTISSDTSANGFAVSKGWGYEFGCYFDVNINSGSFNNGAINPCQVFYNESNRQYTSMTLLAFLEAYPAVTDFSNARGQELLARSVSTYNYIKSNYPAFISGDLDAGFYGASLFLLYDYTGSIAYLQEAFNLRSAISTTFISDATHGNEFYWEEYIRHKSAIGSIGLTYAINNVNPEELFRGKMFQDYKDAGPTAMSNNGERVFQFDPNIQFQNSRYMLTEGLLGAKALELVPNPELFIKTIAHNQLSWLTGMNLVQQGTGLNSTVKPMSFIFGIGSFPTQFHSRWLVNTGYSAATGGKAIGARGTGYQFFDPAGNSYVYLDGTADILGEKLGALGNGWHNESANNKFHVGTVFRNGRTYIPGWISGAFPAVADGDTIFNYNDNLDAYEYTETTNEMVAAAIEYYAYLDGGLNNGTRYLVAAANNSGQFNQTNSTPINSTGNSTGNNSNLSASMSSLALFTIPGLMNITLDSARSAISDANGVLAWQNLTPGSHNLTAFKQNYTGIAVTFTLLTGDNAFNITLNEIAPQPLPNASLAAKIISNATSLIPVSINGTRQYPMREDATAIFSVASDGINDITWYIDGIEQNSTSSKNAVLYWTPGILFVPAPPDFSNTAIAVVKAQSPTESVSWTIQLDNVINPFFSGKDDGADVVGSADAKVRILTNNKYVLFTRMSVLISSESGSTLYPLDMKFNNSAETEWAIYIPSLSPGNNYLSQISGYNDITGMNLSYDLGLSRAHYVTPPPRSSSGSGGSSGGRRGGGSSGKGSLGPQPFEPVLVYALFQKDVVNFGETQTISIDAKNFNGGVYGAVARLMTPKGVSQNITLELVNGTHYYGTWAASFDNILPGQYSLDSIELGGNDNYTRKEIKVQDRMFYALGKGINASANLSLVYLVLSKSQVRNGTSVNLTLDASDPVGITNVTARIMSTRGDDFVIMLELVKGKDIYGTWTGTFAADKPDTTYSVKSITLTSLKGSRTYGTEDRRVYVLADAKVQLASDVRTIQNGITGGFFYSLFSPGLWHETIRKPFVPTFIGFGIMLILVGGLFLAKRK